MSLKVISKIRSGSDSDPHPLLKLDPNPIWIRIRFGSVASSGVIVTGTLVRVSFLGGNIATALSLKQSCKRAD